MARTQLELPALIWSTTLDVRISDINFAGHLAHDRIVSLLHEARARFFRDQGCTELDVDGAGIILTDLFVVYKAEAFFGDVMRIEIGGGMWTVKGALCFIGCRTATNGSSAKRGQDSSSWIIPAAKSFPSRADSSTGFLDPPERPLRRKIVPVP